MLQLQNVPLLPFSMKSHLLTCYLPIPEHDYIYKVVVRDVATEVPVRPIHGYQNPEIIDSMYHLKIMELAKLDAADSQSDMYPESAIPEMVVATPGETKLELS